MSDKAADDFPAIAAKMRDLGIGDMEEAYCHACENGGWECYGIGHHDPHFRECSSCGNPRRLCSP